MLERPTPAQPRGGPALAAAGPGRRSPRLVVIMEKLRAPPSG